MQNPQSIDYKYSVTDCATFACVFVFQKLYTVPYGSTRILIQLTTEVSLHISTATKISFGSKQHNLFSLECIEQHLCSCELLAMPTHTQAPLHKASLVVSQSSFDFDFDSDSKTQSFFPPPL